MLKQILRFFRKFRAVRTPAVMSGLESRTLFSTIVPAAPTNLTASTSSTSVTLHWRDQSSVETGYEVFRGTSKTSLTKINTLGKNSTSYSSKPPKTNTTYYYTVRAVDSAGESKAPTPVSAKVSSSSSSSSSTATSSTKTSSTTTTSSTTFSGKVIHVGPNESIKSLNSVSWPKAGDTPVEIVLDYSSTPYALSQHFLYGKLTIVPADSSKRPTIELGSSYKKQNASTYIAQNPTIMVVGSLTVKNVNTVGGTDTIFLGSAKTGNIDAENVRMTDGGAMWLGSGGQNILFKNNDILGKPRKYAYANFNNTVNNLTIDNSGTNVPVQQGGSVVNGQPVGEAAIRIMDVNTAVLKGITTTPWFYKSGQEWKQDVQLRPSSNLIQVVDCNFYQPDVGDMTWRSPAKPIKEVDFIGSHLTKSPNITNGVSTIKFSDTLIGGTKTTKTV